MPEEEARLPLSNAIILLATAPKSNSSYMALHAALADIEAAVNKVFDPCLKSVKEARGYYINDYQNLLDAQLIEQLRAKYNVVIHQDVIDEITY